ncbi:MAG: MFS transporter [Alphaproteobacteria bacterium]
MAGSALSVRLSVAVLLAGTAVLLLGNGLLMTLLPIRAEGLGFSAGEIGLMGTGHFLGFALGCLLGPRLVGPVGHVRAFAAFAALAAVLALAFPLVPAVLTWIALRAGIGFAFALLFLVIESWLNGEADNAARGGILSVYLIVSNLAGMGGQLSLNLADPSGPVLFSVAAMMIAASLVPVALTSVSAPTALHAVRPRLLRLFRLSPAGAAGCLLLGLMEGAFWSLVPLYARQRGLELFDLTLFLAAPVFGATLSQWFIGRLSDRVDRRLVMLGCAVLAAVFALAILAPVGAAGLLVLAALHGAFALPLYGLAVAHANDWTPRAEVVETGGGLLLLYAAGAVVGPAVAGSLMGLAGPASLLLFVAAVLASLALFVLWRLVVGRQAPAATHHDFRPVSRTTQESFWLDDQAD